LALAEHFISRYAHLTACDVEVREKSWTRMITNGQPHPHSFIRDANGKFFSRVCYQRDGGAVKRSAGILGFVILKTTESGFIGFSKCELTTLKETTDRIFSTSLDAVWDYDGTAADLDQVALDSILEVFANTYSPSVQRTLYLMGEAVLKKCPGVTRIKLTMPNKHYLNLDLSKLGRPEGQKKVFLPTDDPFGYIEAIVAR
jgi:urate oxidase